MGNTFIIHIHYQINQTLRLATDTFNSCNRSFFVFITFLIRFIYLYVWGMYCMYRRNVCNHSKFQIKINLCVIVCVSVYICVYVCVYVYLLNVCMYVLYTARIGHEAIYNLVWRVIRSTEAVQYL